MTNAKELGERIKRLAEDMADAACATEAGAFVQRQRTPLHAAIDQLVSLAQPGEGAMTGWQSIETAPHTRKCFVVQGFNVQPTATSMAGYTTDPYCVWRGDSGEFVRWPHQFPPTHWMPLPTPPGITSTPTGDSNG